MENNNDLIKLDPPAKVNELLTKVAAVLNQHNGGDVLMNELDEFMAMLVKNLDELAMQIEDMRADQPRGLMLNDNAVQDLADLIIVTNSENPKVRLVCEKFTALIPMRHIIVSKIENKINLSAEEVRFIKESML